MSARNERGQMPDVDTLARSMLLLHGGHDDDEHDHPTPSPSTGSWRKAPDYANDPDRAAAIRAASQADRERYLTAGLAPVDCRFCHATVAVKKLGPEHTAVQWSTEATERCAVFAEARANGQNSSRLRACPRLSDSIRHAIAEGCLEAVSSAPSPGDG
ncbi:hypothetical protein [Mycobacterium sp. ACS4331]|uniref:hypothetical protein n=1 Tax=Mycobacterium sp. ACS4331 TaxID=1834121 RepID=UPI0007FE198F|nr:hypothetical protein [Mycobacterium sp. ACS4331]OBF16570.1 hypothetical protein A5727_13620 [Mycobacterium sp. ACS4331]